MYLARFVVLLAALPLLVACNPYMAAVSVVAQSYGVATDERSVATQAKDTEIEGEIKAALIESPVQGIGSLSVYSRQGVVLIAGVMPPGDPAGMTAVQIATNTSGVKRVETFFVVSQPSPATDLEIEGKIHAAFVADSNLLAEQVSSDVYAGHAVLVGVVAGPQQAQEFVQDASGVDGVVSVRSYIQIAQ